MSPPLYERRCTSLRSFFAVLGWGACLTSFLNASHPHPIYKLLAALYILLNLAGLVYRYCLYRANQRWWAALASHTLAL